MLADWSSISDELLVQVSKFEGDPSSGVGTDEDCTVSDLTSRLRVSSPVNKHSSPVFGLLPVSVGPEDDLVFCTKDNVEDCVAYLSQEMTSVGLPSLYEGNQKDIFSITCTINALYHLLQRFWRSVRSRDDLQDSKYRAETELEHRRQESRKLRSQVDQLKRDLAQAHLREKQLMKMNKLANSKLKSEKDEVKRLQVVAQNRDAQYKHLVRKKESELAKLKERLHTLLVDKATDQKVGLEVSDILVRADGKRGRWKASATNSEEELYRNVISAYEEKQKALSVENHELRQALGQVQKELVTLLQPKTKQRNPEQLDQSDFNMNPCDTSVDTLEDSDDTLTQMSDTSVADGHFLLPYSMIHNDLLTVFQQKIAKLKDYVRSLESALANSAGAVELELKYKDEMDRMQKKLERYQDLVDQKQAVGEPVQQSPMVELELKREHERLVNDKRIFYEQLVAFEEKKRNLADVEFRLNKERIAFEMEKYQLTPQNSIAPKLPRPKSAQSLVSSCPQLQVKRSLPSTPNMSSLSENIEEFVSDKLQCNSASASDTALLVCDRLNNTQQASTISSTVTDSPGPELTSGRSSSDSQRPVVASLKPGTVSATGNANKDYLG